MDDVHVIRELEELKGLADPLRFRIVKSLMQAPMSTADLARALGEPPNKLHYHVSELERLGLIEVAETREKGNLIERAYRPIASYYRIDQRLFHGTGEATDVLLQSAQALLDTTAFDLERLSNAETSDGDLSQEMIQTHLRLRLSEDDAGEFRTRMQDMLDEFQDRQRVQAPSEVRVTLVVYPWPDDLGDNEDN